MIRVANLSFTYSGSQKTAVNQHFASMSLLKKPRIHRKGGKERRIHPGFSLRSPRTLR